MCWPWAHRYVVRAVWNYRRFVRPMIDGTEMLSMEPEDKGPGTRVLRVCARCGRARTENHVGHWELSDFTQGVD